jgi:hypothetical protein
LHGGGQGSNPLGSILVVRALQVKRRFVTLVRDHGYDELDCAPRVECALRELGRMNRLVRHQLRYGGSYELRSKAGLTQVCMQVVSKAHTISLSRTGPQKKRRLL